MTQNMKGCKNRSSTVPIAMFDFFQESQFPVLIVYKSLSVFKNKDFSIFFRIFLFIST